MIEIDEQLSATSVALPGEKTALRDLPSAPQTLLDLLNRLAEKGVPNLPGLRSKASLLAELLQKPAAQIMIDDVNLLRTSLRPQLALRRLAENSIRTYVNEIGVLLKYAAAMGWVPDTALPPAWSNVVKRCKEAKCEALCRYLARKRKSPKHVTAEDVEAWIAEYVAMGKAWSTARGNASAFWKVLFECGQISALPPLLREGFGISLENFPGPLGAEVAELLRWKQAHYVPHRPKRGRLRAESAGNLKRSFSELLGYAVNVRGMTTINSLADLVTPEIIGEYIEWGINDRKVRGQSLHARLVVIKAALGQHPRYKDLDLSWLHETIESIPLDSRAELLEKQAAKQIDYCIVESIPDKIRATRRAAAKNGQKQLALAVRDELIMLWLTILPWRQRNIRECRLDGPRPNLFKGKIKPYAPIAKTQWVEEALEKDPDAEFWQFRFSSDETKVGNAVHALVPRPLIPLLEEYVSCHRQHLLCENISETLFLSERGTMMTRARMTILVGELTLRHIGKRITPHTFRHIVAYAWLDAHPDDYLTLSKILFHTNINTTLRCYGARFNESNGACGMEKWVESRRQTGT